MPPPNVLYCPKPVSSSRISTTFGAPLGGWTGCGNCGLSESRMVRPTLPGKWKSDRGSTVGVPPAEGVSALGLSSARAVANLPEAASQPSSVPAASTVATDKVVRVRMVCLLEKSSLRRRVRVGRAGGDRRMLLHALLEFNHNLHCWGRDPRAPGRLFGELLLRIGD